MRSPLAALVLVLGVSACDGEGTVIVQVRTDLFPSHEFASAEVIVRPGDGVPEQRFERAADDADWGRGVRVAEASLPNGTHSMQVRLLDEAGATLVSRPVRFDLGVGEQRVVTVLLTRDCAGVECPASGEDASTAACLAGRCVSAECTEETAGRCAGPECTTEDDCDFPANGVCAAHECSASGACVDVLDHSVCRTGEVCVRSGACVPTDGGTISPSGGGHVHLVTLGGGATLYRLELRDGAPLEDISSIFEPLLPSRDGFQDTSAALSDNGEWLAFISTRATPDGHFLVAPTNDLSAAEVIEGFGPTFDAELAIADDGNTLFYIENESSEVHRLTRGGGGWTNASVSDGSPHSVHISPTYSRDASRLIFGCGNDGSSYDMGICEVRLSDLAFTERFAPGSGRTYELHHPEEMSDLSLLFEATFDTSDYQLYRLPMGSTMPVRFAAPTLTNPCVLPDGRVVALDNFEVVRLAADGTEELRISPSFPSDAYLLFIDDCGD